MSEEAICNGKQSAGGEDRETVHAAGCCSELLNRGQVVCYELWKSCLMSCTVSLLSHTASTPNTVILSTEPVYLFIYLIGSLNKTCSKFAKLLPKACFGVLKQPREECKPLTGYQNHVG